MKVDELLARVVEASGLSGREDSASEIVQNFFTSGPGASWVTDVYKDRLGNVILYRVGKGEPRPRVMFAAHCDEIGLIVTDIEDGFLRFDMIGGVDQRVLPGQEVIVHGREEIPGIIGAKPPHIQSPDEKEKAVKMQDMVIDIGLSETDARSKVSVGDFVSIDRRMLRLRNSVCSGKAMDDRAGVMSLVECLRYLQSYNHSTDVYCVLTVQEEVGLRGAFVSSFGIAPDVGVAVDVTHGNMPGVADYESFDLGKGPVIAIGPQVHPKVLDRLKTVAKENGITYQVEPSPSPGGTDAFAIQMARDGVASGLVSIPLRYMHTSVETLSLDDVRAVGRLLAVFAASIDSEFVEGLKCF